jgi:hypothetical protein
MRLISVSEVKFQTMLKGPFETFQEEDSAGSISAIGRVIDRGNSFEANVVNAT